MKPRFLPWLSVLLFVIACLLPVLTFEKTGGSPGDTWFGYHALLIGWMGFLVGQPGWFANPLWFAGSVFLLPNRGRILSVLLCTGGLLLAITSFNLVGNEVPADEAGVVRQKVKQLHAGLYVWVLSMACQTVVSIYALVQSRRGRKGQDQGSQPQPPPLTTSESGSSRSMSTGQ